jgi:hypothetical protein
VFVEALAGFSFEEAIPAGFDAERLAGYRSGHRAAIRAMLEHLGQP